MVLTTATSRKRGSPASFRNLSTDVTHGENICTARNTFIFSKFVRYKCFFVKYFTDFTGRPFCKLYNSFKYEDEIIPSEELMLCPKIDYVHFSKHGKNQNLKIKAIVAKLDDHYSFLEVHLNLKIS
jgi:hypothetical protein